MLESFTLIIIFTIILLSSLLNINSQKSGYPTANLSTSWIINVSLDPSVRIQDNSIVRVILLRESSGPKYACGFYCNGNCDTYLFGVFVVQTDGGEGVFMPAKGFPQVLWSANPNNPVRINSTVELTSAGDLVLRDADGSLIWSTNTSGMSVVGLNLTELGNLVLFDKRNSVVWQSFDHPSHVMVPGNNLTASASPTSWTQKEYYNLTMTSKGLVAFMDADPPQMAPSVASPRNSEGTNRLLGPVLGSVAGILVVVGLTVFVYLKKKKAREVQQDSLDRVLETPTRFSYEELVLATGNFSKKLGQGGFGSVFAGSLKDGAQIAVKCLDGIGHIKKSFLAEIETIGNIHHVNLVRLIGFCAEKSHRLLVYEFMCNGSLDKWIYHGNGSEGLDWNHRRRIILDIARGLAYLHEGCRQTIIHSDIKPQNILLDENHNAKLGDFGLSKLMDRSQNNVVTAMQGTPGYLAPEWTSAAITEKVDVYSFGIVVLEILCGRKNFEQSKPEEERHLLALFKKKAEEGQWLDLIDKFSDDMQLNAAEVVAMIQSVGWCLQSDHTRRPAMCMAIKAIEGVGNVPTDLDFNLLIPQNLVNNGVQENALEDGSPVLPSILSGPR